MLSKLLSRKALNFRAVSARYVGMAQELLGVLVLGACLIEHGILRTTKEENKYFMRNILDKWRGLVVIYG